MFTIRHMAWEGVLCLATGTASFANASDKEPVEGVEPPRVTAEGRPSEPRPQPVPVPAAPGGPCVAANPTSHDPLFLQASDARIGQLLGQRKILVAEFNQLRTQRAELLTWDTAAQQKFRRAFGTTNEQLRRRVLQRVEEALVRTSARLGELRDHLDFEAYIRSKAEGR